MFWSFIIFSVCMLPFGVSSKNCMTPPTEVNALMDLYNSTNGPYWKTNAYWGVGDPCGIPQWYGVECYNCNVITLKLFNNSLNGYIPSSISDLVELSSLNLNHNSLTGTIPDTIGLMDTLNSLYLNDNLLTGSIPGSMGNLTSLKNLYLEENMLNGTLPSFLQQKPSQLYMFNATGNLFACPLPYWCSPSNASRYCNPPSSSAGCCAPCIGESVIYLAPNGSDIFACGDTNKNACQTLSFASALCSTPNVVFYFNSGIYQVSPVTFYWYTNNITITGNDANLVTLGCGASFPNETLFLLEQMIQFTISDITIQNCSYQILSIESGKFALIKSVISNNHLIYKTIDEYASLFSIGSNEIWINSTIFRNNSGGIITSFNNEGDYLVQQYHSVNNCSFIRNDFQNSTGIGIVVNNSSSSSQLYVKSNMFLNNTGWGFQGCIGFIGTPKWDISISCISDSNATILRYPFDPANSFIEVENNNAFKDNKIRCATCSPVEMASDTIRVGENTLFWIVPIDYCGNAFNSTLPIPEQFGMYLTNLDMILPAVTNGTLYLVDILFNETASNVGIAPVIDNIIVESVPISFFSLVPGITDANTTVAIGAELTNISIYCTNATGQFMILAKDQYGNMQTEEIDFFDLTLMTGNITVVGSVTPIHPFNGTYLAEYEVTIPSVYTMNVLLNGTAPIFGSPFITTVSGISAASSFLFSSTLTPLAGNKTFISLQYMDYRNYPLLGACNDSFHCTEIFIMPHSLISYSLGPLKCVNQSTAEQEVTFFTAGPYSIVATINDKYLAPLHVDAEPGSLYASNCIAFGPLLKGYAIMDEFVEVNVIAKDEWNNTCDCSMYNLVPVVFISGPIQTQYNMGCNSSLEIFTQHVVFTLQGIYAITIAIDNQPVLQGIFNVTVLNVCKEGSYLSGTTCIECAVGTYWAITADGVKCNPCGSCSTTAEAGATSIKDCICAIGCYGLDGICSPCPDHSTTESEGSALIEECICEENYWGLISSNTTECYECEMAGICIGGNSCAEGYTGNLCLACSSGYHTFYGECVKCEAYDPVFSLVIIFAFLAICFLILTSERGLFLSIVAATCAYFRVVAILVQISVQWPISILIVYWILSAFNLNLNLMFPICTSNSSGTYWVWLATFTMPLWAILLVGAFFGGKYLYDTRIGAKTYKIDELLPIMVNFLIGILSWMYVVLNQNALIPLSCIKRPDGVWAIKSMQWVECFTTNWWLEYASAGMMFVIVYSIGIPVFFGALFYRYKSRLEDENIKAFIGCLYEELTPSCFYWEICNITQEFLFVASVSLIPNVAVQISLVSLIALFAIILVYWRKPYARKPLNWADICYSALKWLFATSASMLLANQTPAIEWTAFVIVLVAIIIPLMVMGVAGVLQAIGKVPQSSAPIISDQQKLLTEYEQKDPPLEPEQIEDD